ncbi:unnamed protein product [Chilo suppressalis]|uniref:Chitin-binding type-2 domain-containing protein n=1 Tax=Chilo suppressalis TaxID=168631 RepID=A0ABN8AYA4_CHISP|nr:unnamed protein product [Chilo suppressalis]
MFLLTRWQKDINKKLHLHTLVKLTSIVSWTSAQYQRTSGHQDHSGHGWDIRLAVPGEPGSDYPTLGSIPRTSFSCAGKPPGYYADLETSCQVFRVCTLGSTYGFQSFLCPNGTLFNQAVFVCDWWMNVNCKASPELFDNNNDKFGSLRLGPQLMKDVKKMLTHPMRNPYDKTTMKSNLIVMQDYRPPSGQLFPNEALIAGPERAPNNVYIPAKQVQSPNQQYFNGNDIEYASSTPDPRYLPAAFNSIQQSTVKDAEVFQRQRQNGQYYQNNRLQSSPIRQQGMNPSNTHTGQFSLNNHNANLQFTRPAQNFGNTNLHYGQISNTRPTQTTISYTTNSQNGQHIQPLSQYRNNGYPSRLVNGKHSELSISYNKQQYNAKQQQEKDAYIYRQPQLQFSSEIDNKAGNGAKQNLVSANDVPSTVITKTLTLKRVIQDPKRGSPKSRITVKTWIVKPSKSAKLINPTPYTYDKPTQPPTQRLLDTTPYVYNRPRTTEPERIVADLEEPYIYNKPTTTKQTPISSRVPTLTLSTSTTPQPTLSRLYLSPTTIPPTQASRLYLAPTTYNPSSRIYLPPDDNSIILSRQYLAPLQTNDQLRASPTTPSPTYVFPNIKQSFSRIQDASVNVDRNNLSFTDILTKEKLDLTVDDIVKDTSKYLGTASPEHFERLQDLNSVDYPEENYLPPATKSDSRESLTSVSPSSTPISQNARLVSSPSTELEPPEEIYDSNENQNSNRISSLPFLKESFSPTNTIERTVSLKISIPEKIATYLFKKHNESDFDKLEILNTGSSNYLVLTNNNIKKNSHTNFIPIGKLISDKQSNISNSQNLVFSLLADSINVAKGYNNAQKDTIASSPAQSHFQNINNEELAQITNQISQLTSSQYSVNNNQGGHKSAQIASTTRNTFDNGKNQHRGSTQNQYSQKQVEQIQTDQYNSNPSRELNQYELQLSRYQTGNQANLQSNTKQLYSGQLYQLPVPDVTKQVYNQNVNSVQNNRGKPNADVEIIKSESVPVPPASARLEASPTSELDHFNSKENFSKLINSNNGISAQLQDKIVGIIPHPLEDNKVVTYKKDESYYVYTKLDNSFGRNFQSNGNNVLSNNVGQQQSARLIQGNNLPNVVAFQFIPSVSYQLEDEREQQKLLNAFHIDENGIPKQKSNLVYNSNQPFLTSNVNYSVDHTIPTKEANRQHGDVSNLYAGPSSYSAPQSSVGRLVSKQNMNSKLELENNSNGYSRTIPSRHFTF